MNINTNDSPIRPLWLRMLIFCLFLTTSSLLAGYVAIELQFPSLYNVNARFAEYAIPFPFLLGVYAYTFHANLWYSFAAFTQNNAMLCQLFSAFLYCVLCNIAIYSEPQNSFFVVSYY